MSTPTVSLVKSGDAFDTQMLLMGARIHREGEHRMQDYPHVELNYVYREFSSTPAPALIRRDFY